MANDDFHRGMQRLARAFRISWEEMMKPTITENWAFPSNTPISEVYKALRSSLAGKKWKIISMIGAGRIIIIKTKSR